MMKIIAKSTFHIPGFAEFTEGQNYQIDSALCATLCERQLVEVVETKEIIKVFKFKENNYIPYE